MVQLVIPYFSNLTADDGVEQQFFISCKLGASKKSSQMFFISGKNCCFCSLFLKILHSLKRTNPTTTAVIHMFSAIFPPLNCVLSRGCVLWQYCVVHELGYSRQWTFTTARRQRVEACQRNWRNSICKPLHWKDPNRISILLGSFLGWGFEHIKSWIAHYRAQAEPTL